VQLEAGSLLRAGVPLTSLAGQKILKATADEQLVEQSAVAVTQLRLTLWSIRVPKSLENSVIAYTTRIKIVSEKITENILIFIP
jgi:hypothetical protein